MSAKDQISLRIPPGLHKRIKDTCPHGLTRSQWINVLIGERLDSIAKYSGDRWRPKPRMPDAMAEGNLSGGDSSGSSGDFSPPESYA